MHICLYKKALRFLSAAMYWTVASVGFVSYLIIVLERRHRNNFFSPSYLGCHKMNCIDLK